MEPTPAPDGVREWLLQLERRIAELERLAQAAERRRRRSLWYMVVAVLVYALFLYSVTNSF